MKSVKFVFLGLFCTHLLLMASPAPAQFAGDLLFGEPSIAIPEDGQGTLEVQVFSGADTFGAAQFDLLFDPDRLKVVAVRPGETPDLQDGFTVVQSEGRVSIIVVNGGSLDLPFGTSSLAEIDVQPLVGAGNIIPVANQVEDVLRQDSSPYAFPVGLSAEVVVTAAGATTVSTQSAPEQPLEVVPGSDLYDRVTAMRRPGSVVKLMELDENQQAHAILVQSAGNSLESESNED